MYKQHLPEEPPSRDKKRQLPQGLPIIMELYYPGSRSYFCLLPKSYFSISIRGRRIQSLPAYPLFHLPMPVAAALHWSSGSDPRSAVGYCIPEPRCRTDAYEHFNKLRTVDREKRHTRLAGHRPGQHRLAGTRWAILIIFLNYKQIVSIRDRTSLGNVSHPPL